jgi:hypothetical protein
MRLKAVLRLILLLFLAASLVALVVKVLRSDRPAGVAGDAGAAQGLPGGDRLIVYYAHGKFRCRACNSLEEYAQVAVAGFPRELAQGRLEWRVVDYEEPGNEWFADRYKLPGPSVVLVCYRHGKPAQGEVLQAAWELLRDKAAAVEYVRREIRGRLEGK